MSYSALRFRIERLEKRARVGAEWFSCSERLRWVLEQEVKHGDLPDARPATVASRTKADWLGTPNVGRKTVIEIERVLAAHGLTFAVQDPRI